MPRGRPKGSSSQVPKETAEQLLQREQLECLRQARKVRESVADQTRILLEKIEDNPGIKTEDRLEVISGLAVVYEKLIRATEITKKHIKEEDSGGEGTLEEILGKGVTI